MWKSTAGSDLAHALPADLRPESEPAYSDSDADASREENSQASDGLDSFRDASLVADLQPRPRPHWADNDERKRGRWKGTDELPQSKSASEPTRTPAAGLAGLSRSAWMTGLGIVAAVSGVAMFYWATSRTPPAVNPADESPNGPIVAADVRPPVVVVLPAPPEPGDAAEGMPPAPSPMPMIVTPAPVEPMPSVTPPSPAPSPMEIAPAPPMRDPVEPTPPPPMPAAAPMPAAPLPDQLRPLSSPRAETLLSMARQLEASGRIEAAIRRYTELVEKFHGTAVADEAESRLAALRAPRP